MKEIFKIILPIALTIITITLTTKIALHYINEKYKKLIINTTIALLLILLIVVLFFSPCETLNLCQTKMGETITWLQLAIELPVIVLFIISHKINIYLLTIITLIVTTIYHLIKRKT